MVDMATWRTSRFRGAVVWPVGVCRRDVLLRCLVLHLRFHSRVVSTYYVNVVSCFVRCGQMC